MSDMQRAGIPDTTVVIVAISSAAHIRRCLRAIESQCNGGSYEIIVAADSRLGALDDVAAEFPAVRVIQEFSAITPGMLTALALGSARGERIALTEDSCIAGPDWLEQLHSIDSAGHGAVGGSVEVIPRISSSMWAFAYVDFYRYMPPLRKGVSPSLSVCNVAYSAERLRAVHEQWRDGFNESVVNEALEQRFGSLFLNPEAKVRVSRNVALSDAIYERYAFGRLFGATRISHSGVRRRVALAVLAVGLPFLLMGRLTAKALTDASLLRPFVRALPVVLLLVIAWSWGEWLGYVTKSLPQRITTAPEIAVDPGSSRASA
jgi:glycosyltransferase involved in cell wall biosynthesis